MKVYLKENWSDQFGFDGEKSSNIFSGRVSEIKSLVHAIQNNSSGTILVSSVRGVGKTSFVHKALSEIRDEVIPIFVEASQSSGNVKPSSRSLLGSLIRAVYLAKNFKNDQEIVNLYHQSVAKYKKAKEQTSSNETKKEQTLGFNITEKAREFIKAGALLFFAGLSGFGISLNSKLITILGLGFLSIAGAASLNWRRLTTNTFLESDSILIDDSDEYLSTMFEQWLDGRDKKQKVVFVVDELDTDGEEVFETIKQYKNLFARSSAHFIFICNQSAYAFTQQDREKSKIPTIFTHVYYLPTPTTKEMNDYLDEIFVPNVSDPELSDLKKYLLFTAANDYFAVKNLINDLSEFDTDGQYLDTATVRKTDKNYSDASRVYDYLDVFYRYYSRAPKSFWQRNSEIQREVFSFVRKNLMKDFSVSDEQPEILQKLTFYLRRVGAIKDKSPSTEDAGSGDETIRYFSWTARYSGSESLDQLFPEDEKFISAMGQLIQTANDLNDLSFAYENGNFSDGVELISEGGDGEAISGVSLFNIYQKYIELYQSLKNPDDAVVYHTAEEASDATKEIEGVLKSLTTNTFNILTNCLEKISSEDNRILVTARSVEINPAFAVKSWTTAFKGRVNRLFRIEENGKQVLFIQGALNFRTDARILAIAELSSNKSVLAFNIYDSTEAKLKEHLSVSVNKIGHKRKKTTVKNFTNVPRPSSFRQLAPVLKQAVDHLKVDLIPF